MKTIQPTRPYAVVVHLQHATDVGQRDVCVVWMAIFTADRSCNDALGEAYGPRTFDTSAVEEWIQYRPKPER